MRFILAFLFLSFNLSICSCDCNPLSVEAAFEKFELIAVGKVLKISEGMVLPQPRWYLDSLENRHKRIYFGPMNCNQVSLEVKELIKGKSGIKKMSMRTAPFSASCGFDFQEGKKYLIYAEMLRFGDDYYVPTDSLEVFYVHQCSRTKKFNRAELRQLRNIQ